MINKVDILTNGLVDFLKEKYPIVLRNRGPRVITFFYGDSFGKLKTHKIDKKNISAKLPQNNIKQILKNMINQRPPSDDLQKGEVDPSIEMPTKKYSVVWVDVNNVEHKTTILSDDILVATQIVEKTYKDFQKIVYTERVLD